MSTTFDSLVDLRVSSELQQGAMVDVYRVASDIHAQHAELTVHEIAEVVAESVVRARGNAVWTKNPLL